MKKIYKHPQAIVIANLGPTIMFDTSGGGAGVSELPRAKENDSFDFYGDSNDSDPAPQTFNVWED